MVAAPMEPTMFFTISISARARPDRAEVGTRSPVNGDQRHDH
jgi:hypothetical protein